MSLNSLLLQEKGALLSSKIRKAEGRGTAATDHRVHRQPNKGNLKDVQLPQG